MAEPRIRFDGVTKSFGAVPVVDDLSFEIERGEFVSLLGPSGSGKTMILMMLAGFTNPTSGSVWLDGRRIEHLPSHQRNMGVVFQNYALFPHMNVGDNIAFPLKMRHVSKASRTKQVKRILDMVQLKGLQDRRPGELSGGQQQRVALARALVFEPTVILMDEPLSALDKQLREQMQLDIRELHKRLELTVVFVTHDQSEALTMSDRIAVLNAGKIEQYAPPREIYDRPGSWFVAQFMGETNLVHGTVKAVTQEKAVIACDKGAEIVVGASESTHSGGRVIVSVRPERVQLSADPGGEANVLRAAVVDSIYQGNHLRVQLDSGAMGFFVRRERRDLEFAAGETVFAKFRPSDCWVMAK